MHITVNGTSLFYEKSGEGPPMLLLHGNGEDHHLFDKAAKLLAGRFTLYAPDSRGHGQSDPVSELHYRDMAADMAAFITALGLDKPLVLGFSDGGIIGLELAMGWPTLPGGLICCGANTRTDQCRPLFTALIKLGWRATKDPKMRLMLEEPNIPNTALAAIQTPTLLLAGSRDILPMSASAEIAKAIPGARLRILPGETHGSYIRRPQKLMRAIEPFLGRYLRDRAGASSSAN